MPDRAAPNGTNPFYLNVIFHGRFIFVIYNNRIEALAADVKEHVVGAGTFLKERPCPPGIYSLSGVRSPQTPSMGAVDPKTHFILDANKTKFQISADSYYRFILPKIPSYITPLGLLTPDQKLVFLGRDAGSITNPDKFGSAHAFIYKIKQDGTDTDDEPELDTLQWRFEVHSVNGIRAINLHIFAESPYLLDLLHPNRDFSSLVVYLAGLSLDVQKPFPDIKFEPNSNNYGIRDDEQKGLRGLPAGTPLVPPRICDSPSMVVINATDTAP
jgi:hypothetical protein